MIWKPFQDWLAQLPYADSFDRRQASIIQLLELGVLLATVVLTLLAFFGPSRYTGSFIIGVLVMLAGLSAGVALALVRSGRAQASTLLMAISIVIGLSLILYGTTLQDGALVLFAFALPIAIGGLLTGRRGLLLVLVLSIVGVSAALLLEEVGAPGAGFAKNTAVSVSSVTTIPSFIVLIGLLGLFIDSMSSIAREALAARRIRERELEALSRRLEATVRERTADLEMALDNLQLRAAEQERLLAENASQQAAIRELSVPVLPVSATTMVMPLIGSLDGDRLAAVQERALDAMAQSTARRLLLDITGVPVVDSYVAKGLLDTLQAANLLGVEVVLVGIRPEVAQAIVGLGLDLSQMRTYADLQSALK